MLDDFEDTPDETVEEETLWNIKPYKDPETGYTVQVLNCEFDRILYYSNYVINIDVPSLPDTVRSRYKINPYILSDDPKSHYNKKFEVRSVIDGLKYVIYTIPKYEQDKPYKYKTLIVQVPNDYRQKPPLYARIECLKEMCSDLFLSKLNYRYIDENGDNYKEELTKNEIDLIPRVCEVAINFFQFENEHLQFFFVKHLNLKYSRFNSRHKQTFYIAKQTGMRTVSHYDLAYKGIKCQYRVEITMEREECNKRKIQTPEDLLKVDWVGYVQEYVDFVDVDFGLIRRRLGSKTPKELVEDDEDEFFKLFSGEDITTELKEVYDVEGLHFRAGLKANTLGVDKFDVETVAIQPMKEIGPYTKKNPYKMRRIWESPDKLKKVEYKQFDREVEEGFKKQLDEIQYNAELAKQWENRFDDVITPILQIEIDDMIGDIEF